MGKRFVLVTGSSRGIGRAIVKELAHDGYTVFVHCKSQIEKAKKVVSEIKEIGGVAYVLEGDITKESDVERIFTEISKITDHLDVLVNNAGFDYGYLIEDYTIDQMRELVELILIARFSTTKYALPLLKKSPYPSIINIASRMGREKTIETVGPYASAEAGIIKFTQCCALEFRKYQIRVNAIAPGFTDTDLTRNLIKDAGVWERAAKANPRGRLGKPEDVAKAVSFLVSEKADYINGETISVTGGSSLG